MTASTSAVDTRISLRNSSYRSARLYSVDDTITSAPSRPANLGDAAFVDEAGQLELQLRQDLLQILALHRLPALGLRGRHHEPLAEVLGGRAEAIAEPRPGSTTHGVAAVIWYVE